MPDHLLPPRAVVNLVFFALIFNVFIMALAFAIVAGLAHFTNAGSAVKGLFGPAAGFLFAVAAFLGTIRAALVELLAGFALPDEE